MSKIASQTHPEDHHADDAAAEQACCEISAELDRHLDHEAASSGSHRPAG